MDDRAAQVPQMTNGFHSHYCPRCQADKDCAQITHCRRLSTSLCADCIYEDLLEQNKDKETADGSSKDNDRNR